VRKTVVMIITAVILSSLVATLGRLGC